MKDLSLIHLDMNKLNATKQWRDAATLILVARSGAKRNGYKILMLKRSAKSKFMVRSLLNFFCYNNFQKSCE